MRKVYGSIISVGMLAAAWLCATEAFATPQNLNCVLTAPAADSAGAAGGPITIIVDPEAKTLTAELGPQRYSFSDPSISNVSISGQADAVSLGIDRSSLGIVWQQYHSDKVITQFGQCRRDEQPAVTNAH